MREAIDSGRRCELDSRNCPPSEASASSKSAAATVMSSRAMHSHGAEVVGVDITPTAVELCRQRFEHMGLPGSFRVADAEQLPFADASFDCVCSMGGVASRPEYAARRGRDLARAQTGRDD